jgi:hypothetical protein
VLEALSKKKPEFSADDLSKISAQLGGKPKDLVERLLESGVIYEVAPGRFRVT